MKYLFFFLFAWVSLSLAAVRYGSTLIQDSDGDSLAIDSLTWGVLSVDIDQSELFNGNKYWYDTVDYDFDDTDTAWLSLCPTENSTKEISMSVEIYSTGACSLAVTEKDTVSGGSALTPNNQNRNSSATASLGLKFNPAVVDTGDTLGLYYITGTKIMLLDGQILKQDTCSTIWLKSATDNQKVNVRTWWRETTPK